MVSVYSLIILMAMHWCGDFVMQTNWQATNKSRSWKALLHHTVPYSLYMGLFCVICMKNWEAWALFTLITFVAHTATDYVTSRINKKLYDQNRIHDFFVSVGFDQLLHFIQLSLTYYYLNQALCS
jgi:Protein of unknown function (DUF3307)